MVVFDRFMTEDCNLAGGSKSMPDAIRILDTSDLHCLRRARGEQLKHGGDLNLFNEIALREIASIFRSDLTLMISKRRSKSLRRFLRSPTPCFSICH